MDDDKRNDVWVSCCHGNNASLGMGMALDGVFLVMVMEEKHSGKKPYFTELWLMAHARRPD